MADERVTAPTPTSAPVKPGLELPAGGAPERPSAAQPTTAEKPAGPGARAASGSVTTEAKPKTPEKERHATPRKMPPKTPRTQAGAKAAPRKTAGPKAATRPRSRQDGKSGARHHAPARQAAAPIWSAYGEEAVAACAESGARAAKGFESLSKEILEFGRSTVDANLAQVRALLAVRSLGEALALQRDFAGAQFGALVDEAAKLGRLGATAAQDTLAPLAARADAAARRNRHSKAA